jgi:sensor histidine kinase regulating citrate/malate metabolism
MADRGLPSTTKNNSKFHGYGLKSIQAAANKYGGSMTVASRDQWFVLKILIPIPEEVT